MRSNGSLDRFYLEHEYSKGHLSQILRGVTDPKLSTIVRLARALGVEVTELFESSRRP